ncbi:MAG: hypothetical protein KKF50_05695 [Nanoarchaeota archaeon]|nr:hypothetical protein [Nanoarchaeota archaeon]
MVYAVYGTETFEKEFEKLGKDYQDSIKKIFLQLKENSYVGDPIRYKFFREKRVKEKRIYYIVYEEFSSILVVAVEGKKAQQDTINEIIKLLPEFKIYMKELLS